MRTLLGVRLVDTGSGYCSRNMMLVHIGLPAGGAVDVESPRSHPRDAK